jgi:hypothetical protein
LNSDTESTVLAVHTATSEVDLRLIQRETSVQIDLFLSKPLTKEKIRRLLRELEDKNQKTRPKRLGLAELDDQGRAIKRIC